MLRQKKGIYGYFHKERIRRGIVTFILFAIPLFIFATGLLYFGKRENLCTVIAVVGCLPACKSLVGLIMVFLHGDIPQEEYTAISARKGSLQMCYEMYITTGEKSGYVDAFAICGNQVVGYTSDNKADIKHLSQFMEKMLRSNHFAGVQVHILKELSPYLERLDSLNRNRESLTQDIPFTPDEQYPDLSREELIKHTILAVAI